MDQNQSFPVVSSNPPPAAAPDPVAGQGCLGEAGWMASGLVLPVASVDYYRLATRRRTILAVVFFLILGCLASILITAGLARGMGSMTAEIERAYVEGKIPPITIQDGIASVNAPQPLTLLSDENTVIMIDTTGQVTELDTTRYQDGLLITRTEAHLLSQNGRYQRIPLSTLNQMFSANPLVIDQATVTRGWQGFSAFFSIFAFLGVLLWTTIIRLGYIALLALPIWGVVSLIRANTPFNPIFITGIYASVPALYTLFLLEQVKVDFLFLGTLVLLFYWLVILVLLFRSANRPLARFADVRPWRALIGVPALLMFAIQSIFSLPNGGLIVWIVALLTIIALAAVTFWPRGEPAA